MKVAIIGGGFTGLTAALRLAKEGHTVTVFEKEAILGGLAHGFRQKGWAWHLEYAYHHWFTNDRAILALARELGLDNKLMTLRPTTATLWRSRVYPLDSPKSLLLFPGLPLIDRLRTGALLAALKLNPFWRPLEAFLAKDFFRLIGGGKAWKTIWEPLMVGKFSAYADHVQAAWLWARVKKRTPSLGYFQGGFHVLVLALEKAIQAHNGTIFTNAAITSVRKEGSRMRIIPDTTFRLPAAKQRFDRVLLTVPTPIAASLAPQIPKSYFHALLTIPHLHAQTLILETDAPILKDVYWLNITDRKFPFLAAVAHTNFVDTKHYGGHHLTYFGNYLPSGHPYLSMNKADLLKAFLPFIRRLSGNKQIQIHNTFSFVGPFAQPVHERFYSKKIPSIATPIPGLFLANMDFVVPWDRGTNYAVELGSNAAATLTSEA
jgi:protoporphyrinogen oxidase